jgi:hypothetical protein
MVASLLEVHVTRDAPEEDLEGIAGREQLVEVLCGLALRDLEIGDGASIPEGGIVVVLLVDDVLDEAAYGATSSSSTISIEFGSGPSEVGRE